MSGPLLDRIDLQSEVSPLIFSDLSDTAEAERSSLVRGRVSAARALQTQRLCKYPGVYANAHMDAGLVQKVCPLPAAGRGLLRAAMDKLHLSARAYDRVSKVARTIEDFAGS